MLLLVSLVSVSWLIVFYITMENLPCHRLEERTLSFMKGRRKTLCARCTAIYGSYILLPVVWFIFDKIKLNHVQLFLAFCIGVLSLIPLIADGITQAKGIRKSNNFLRFTTGLLFGVGLHTDICSFIFFIWEGFL